MNHDDRLASRRQKLEKKLRNINNEEDTLLTFNRVGINFNQCSPTDQEYLKQILQNKHDAFKALNQPNMPVEVGQQRNIMDVFRKQVEDFKNSKEGLPPYTDSPLKKLNQINAMIMYGKSRLKNANGIKTSLQEKYQQNKSSDTLVHLVHAAKMIKKFKSDIERFEQYKQKEVVKTDLSDGKGIVDITLQEFENALLRQHRGDACNGLLHRGDACNGLLNDMTRMQLSPQPEPTQLSEQGAVGGSTHDESKKGQKKNRKTMDPVDQQLSSQGAVGGSTHCQHNQGQESIAR